MRYYRHGEYDLIGFVIFFVVMFFSYIVSNPEIMKFIVFWGVIIAVIYFVFRPAITSKMKEYSIMKVDKKYVIGSNKIANDNCIITFKPKNSIVVFDKKIVNNKKRMFSVSLKADTLNEIWDICCRSFSIITTFDDTSSLCANYTDVYIINLDQPKTNSNEVSKNASTFESEAKFVDLNNITPDSYALGNAQNNISNQSFTNISDIKPVDSYNEKRNTKDVLYDLPSNDTKIDINTAGDEELAKLPGINIVLAKKIVEYRNLNGDFKSVDDFIKMTNIKEHFIPAIKEAITLKHAKLEKVSIDDNEGRIIDF